MPLLLQILLFIIPSKNKGQKLISWEDAVKLPWGILLLFGGGLAIANGFKTTGLADWIGNQITLIETLPLFIVIFLIISIVNFLTEITSNLATTAMLLPVMAPIALSLNINPYTLMVSTTVAASCAFMLPVATAPNALVFGSRLLKIPDMIKAGIWMNIISIIILSLLVYLYCHTCGILIYLIMNDKNIFIHIPKTGGTTINAAMNNSLWQTEIGFNYRHIDANKLSNSGGHFRSSKH